MLRSTRKEGRPSLGLLVLDDVLVLLQMLVNQCDHTWSDRSICFVEMNIFMLVQENNVWYMVDFAIGIHMVFTMTALP